MKKLIKDHVVRLGPVLGLALIAGSVHAEFGLPLTCTTENASVVAISDPDTGAFPVFYKDCSELNMMYPAEPCSDFGYQVTQSRTNNAQSVFQVSAELELVDTDPNAFIGAIGEGDSTTNFLEYVQTDFSIRFNQDSTVEEAHIIVFGSIAPIPSTVVTKQGQSVDSCLIAGPGVEGDPFQPVAVEQLAIVAGGGCEVKQIFDSFGNLVDIEVITETCEKSTYPDGLFVNGKKVQNNKNFTVGDNTCTCYGPPFPRTPICISDKVPSDCPAQ
jgi:hypothetical protein